MAEQFTCDMCKNVLDNVTSIRKAHGMLYIPIEGISIDMTIHLEIKNPTLTGYEVCYLCIGNEMIRQVQHRKEVIKTEKP